MGMKKDLETIKKSLREAVAAKDLAGAQAGIDGALSGLLTAAGTYEKKKPKFMAPLLKVRKLMKDAEGKVEDGRYVMDRVREAQKSIENSQKEMKKS